MKRIAIIGSGGAGKSTLARQLGRSLGIEVYHLDKLMWKRGWIMSSDEEELQIQSSLVARETWIIDGNYGKTMPIRLEAADTIVFLDRPRWLCLWRIVTRYFKNVGHTRADMAERCPDECDWEFIQWVWNYPRRFRPIALERIERLGAGKTVYRLRTQREVEQFLDGIRHD